MSMCFEREWKAGSSESILAASLSHRIGVAPAGGKSTAVKSWRSQAASRQDSAAEIYSESVVDCETVDCLREDQETKPLVPRVKQYAPTDFRLSGQQAKLASVNPMMLTSWLPPNRRRSVQVRVDNEARVWRRPSARNCSSPGTGKVYRLPVRYRGASR